MSSDLEGFTNQNMLAELLFPYSFKSYQREFLHNLVLHSHVLWQAPTGFGKTIVSLTSMIPFLLDNKHPLQKIIFFVRTKTQVFRILDECNKLTDSLSKLTEFSNRTIRSLPLIGKEELCVHPQKVNVKNIDCQIMQCPKVNYKLKEKKYYNTLMEQFYYENPRKTKDYIKIVENSEKFQNHCPYIVMKKLLYDSDIIITTHAFFIQSSLFKYLKETIFRDKTMVGVIIDEVHNIKPSRNAELLPKKIKTILDMEIDFMSRDFLNKLYEYIKSNEGYIKPYIKEEDYWMVERLQTDCNLLLKTAWKYQVEIKALADIIAFFDAVGDLWFIDKKVIDTIDPERKIFSKILVRMVPFPQTIFRHFKGVSRCIAMSGTIEPMELFKKYLNLEEKFHILKVPVDKQNIRHFIFTNPKLTSKFKNRSSSLFSALAHIIKEFHQTNPHHTLVFNTSKSFTKTIGKFVKDLKLTSNLYVEGTSAYNQSLLEELKSLSHELVFATMGGVFSEGVEIKDPKTGQSKITLIIITGIPHPPPNLENKLLNVLYKGVYGKKFAKVYLEYLPMYQLIQQAVGRGIRSYESDYCAVISIDYRLAQMGIWRGAKYSKNIGEIKSELDNFLKKASKE